MNKLILALILSAGFFNLGGASNSISLDSKWQFQLDRADAGIQERWFARNLSDHIQLPGSLPAQGIGDDIATNTVWTGGTDQSTWFTAPEYAKYRQPGNVKVPFWLQPDKYYAGVAWFERDIDIPSGWKGRRVILSMERPHWETRVWIDNKLIGTNNSLSTPHEYDLGQLVSGKHHLAIRVDNRRIVDIGENSHAITDHTQGNWNGIVGAIELRSSPLVWIDDVQVYPSIEKKDAVVKIRVGNATGLPGSGSVSVGKQSATVNWDAQGGEVSMTVPLGGKAQTWDEFHPALQHLTVLLQAPARDSREITFGLREISTEGTQFLINGRKSYIRGTLECCIFPKTGHPPIEVGEWKRIIQVAKSYGLNLIRFHSYCPPEAAFVAADELGFYYQVETCWANQSTTIGDGKPVDQWVYDETDRILRAYGNHPSFIFMPYGNEPGGVNAKADPNSANAPFHGFFDKFVAHYKALDPRRFYTSGAGWPQIPENQFDVTPDPRIQLWGAGLKSRINAKPPETTTDYRDYINKRSVPVISHEIGQWCVYPNFDEMPKYTGYLKPKNFEIFRDRLNENGMGELAKPFLLASGKLQTLCYKEDIESALRTPGMGGFELLDLHDFPGQGTALVGVLDPFWEEKGYVTAKEYSRFCNRTVPLARMAKRVFTTDENLQAQIEVAHFGPQPIEKAVAKWKLIDDAGKVLARGALLAQTIPVDNAIVLGNLNVELRDAKAPARYKLVVSLAGTPFQNNWDLWVYPAQLPSEPSGILVKSQMDNEAQRCLQKGGKVLLTLPGSQVRNFDNDPVKLGFSSIFWNTVWTRRQAPSTLGILCDPKHLALAQFPTEFCSNWQWWYLMHRAGALRLDVLPKDIKPVVRVIDDWFTARPLGLIVEAKLGAGKLMICGFDLTDSKDPVTRQMRASLLHYMAGQQFQPRVELNQSELKALLRL